MTDGRAQPTDGLMPALGFGTWELASERAEQAVAIALDAGYRHIDTAQWYGNEDAVGRALASSRVDRDQVFVTTKIPPQLAGASDVHASHRASLDRLKLDRVDLLLLHYPSDVAPLSETLTAMTELQDAGLTRYLGVSNFPSALLREAYALAPIVTDQMEHHPYLAVDAVRAVLGEHGGWLTAYSPLARGAVLQDPVLLDIAQGRGRTVAQVVLRWHLQHDATAVIPKASTRERIEENAQVFDFTLSAEEMSRIDALARGERHVDPEWGPQWDV